MASLFNCRARFGEDNPAAGLVLHGGTPSNLVAFSAIHGSCHLLVIHDSHPLFMLCHSCVHSCFILLSFMLPQYCRS